MVPGKVDLQEKVVQVSAGDSHTKQPSPRMHCLPLWGSFRVRLGLEDGCGAVSRIKYSWWGPISMPMLYLWRD